ncbi:MAG: HAD hydrolase-like protein [Lachnospiraceae bacterium]|nr:HAD hydrolase-like protein [Lachnospiraceae bacterium]
MKDYLVCIDSDGCAMDTMTVKHVECFGPCLIDEWNLEKWKDDILDKWNQINLYTVTRGINRFQGLKCILDIVDSQYTHIEGIKDLEEWLEGTPALSEKELEAAIEGYPDKKMLKKALSWSRTVNRKIGLLPDECKAAFSGVECALKTIREKADIAIVSSANPSALKEEWNRCGLIPYVNYTMAQDMGTKDACIISMISRGYKKEKIIMLGDAPGDCKAAKKAQVSFYPILVNHEEQSWKEFTYRIFPEFVSGNYTEAKQEEQYQKFIDNLGN